jgi:hypothetical protein
MVDSHHEFIRKIEERTRETKQSTQKLQEVRQKLAILKQRFTYNHKKQQQQVEAITNELHKKNSNKTKLDKHRKILHSIVDSQKKITEQIKNLSSQIQAQASERSAAMQFDDYLPPSMKKLEEMMTIKQKVEDFYKRFTEATRAFSPNSDFNKNKARIDNCVLDAIKLLENDLIIDINAGDSSLDQSLNNYKKSIASRLENFVKEQKRIADEYNEKEQQRITRSKNMEKHENELEKLKDEIALLSTTEQNLDNKYASFLASSYKLDEIAVDMAKTYLSNPILISEKDQKELQQILDEFENDCPLTEDIINVELPEKTDHTTNVTFINKKIKNINTQNLTLAEHAFALQTAITMEIINLAEQFKCSSDESLALKYLTKFTEKEFYDCNSNEFMQGLDQFSQNYLKKIQADYLKNPKKVSMDFFALAVAISTAYSNFKKVEQVCSYLQKLIITKYANPLNIVKEKYPGIKTLHKHKLLQWKFDRSLDNVHDEQQKTGTRMTTSVAASNKIACILKKEDYAFEENLDLLVYCIDKIINEINKLMKEKLISIVNNAWKHNKTPTQFISSTQFIVQCCELMNFLIGKIEQYPDFNGWK